jgi:DNA topoisomerase-2
MNVQKICIIGDGLAGLMTAVTLSKQNVSIDLYSSSQKKSKNLDNRTTAISESNFQYIKSNLTHGEVSKKLIEQVKTPFYNGFNGTITQGDNSAQWIINGVATKDKFNAIKITEVPVGYTLLGYIKVLDKLVDDGVIQNYQDKSEDDNFEFIAKVNSKTLKSWSDEQLIDKLKLTKKVTENYTAMDENNKIIVCNDVVELINKYIDVKKHYISLRKNNSINVLNDLIALNNSRYEFIKRIVNNQLIISKRKKVDVVADLDKIDIIIKRDGSYDYLLNLSIMSLTSERMEKIKNEVIDSKNELKVLKNTTIENLWITEIDQVKL